MKKKYEKVLVISYLFPPLGGGGVIRVTKFVKYLSSFGWKPYVLAVKKGFYKIEDKSLLNEIPKEVEIKRIGYFEPAFWFKNRFWQSFLAYLVYPWFLIPDRQILWLVPAIFAALKIIKKEKIKVIFTTSAPVSDHLIGLILKKVTGVKWVADFRDEWANNPLKKYPTPIHCLLNQFLEKIAVKNANEIISVSGPITEYLKKISPDKKKFSTITNGFDEADFRGLKSSESKIFRLVHAGSLYNLKYQESFIQAFQSLNLKDASLTFIGKEKRFSHRQAIRKMIDANVLLLILDPVERPGVLTGKLFEYLRTQKPILALVYRNSEAAKMINKYQAGEVIEPNQEDFKKMVKKFYQKWRKNDLKVPKVNLEEYERKNLTEKLAKVFEKLIKNTRKTKLCLIGNIESSQNKNLCRYFALNNYEVSFITTGPGKVRGVKSYYLGKNHFTPWYFARSTYKIRKIIQDIKPDIVHGQDLVFGGIWAYLSGFHPFLVTTWGSDVWKFDSFIPLEKKLICSTLQKADLITGSSLALREQSLRIGMPKEKWQLIHFGIDLNIFKKKEVKFLKSKFKLGHSKIIYCPRSVAPIYNTDVLVEAFAKIAKKGDFKLLLTKQNADDLYLLKIEKLVIKNNLVDKIIFLPSVDWQFIPDLYNLADVVVSLTSSDGCSVSFLEAMASEKKIVATNLPYIKEWISNQNIWTVPIRNINATAEVITTALRCPKPKWQKIGRQNRAMIAQKAEINSNFEGLDRLYQSLI